MFYKENGGPTARREGPPFAAFAQSFQGRRKKRKNGGNNTQSCCCSLARLNAACQLALLLKRARGGLKELKNWPEGQGPTERPDWFIWGFFGLQNEFSLASFEFFGFSRFFGFADFRVYRDFGGFGFFKDFLDFLVSAFLGLKIFRVFNFLGLRIFTGLVIFFFVFGFFWVFWVLRCFGF